LPVCSASPKLSCIVVIRRTLRYCHRKICSEHPKYTKGIGTQANPITRYVDAWIPNTWDDRIEAAYHALAQQTAKWQRQDPQAQVRIAEVGYSRGAVLAVGLARLVDTYGIAD